MFNDDTGIGYKPTEAPQDGLKVQILYSMNIIDCGGEDGWLRVMVQAEQGCDEWYLTNEEDS